MDFRYVLNKLRNLGELAVITDELSPEYEIPFIISKLEKKYGLLFENISNYKGWRIASGIYTSEQRLAKILEISLNEFRRRYSQALKKPGETIEVSKSPAYEIIWDRNIDLSKIPIPIFYEKTPKYLTASIIVAHDPETGVRNLSYHRMTPIDKNKFAVRVVERDLWTYMMKAKAQGKKYLEAVVIIGVDPATALAASTSVPIDVDELAVAAAILQKPIEEIKARTVNVYIPANTEIVLEGVFLLDVYADEGPFVDITKTYDKVRKQPVFEVKLIAMRKNPILHIILPAGYEHMFLMGYPAETMIREYVSRVTRLHDVHLSYAGCYWLEAIISIDKRHPDEPINAGLAAFSAHPSLKKVIIVDPDIDIRNPEDVEWAVITRAHPVRDIIIIPRAKGSSLDKSGEPRAKIIIDATIKGDKRSFMKAKIPMTPRVLRIIRKLKEHKSGVKNSDVFPLISTTKHGEIKGKIIKMEKLSFLGEVNEHGKLPNGETLHNAILCLKSGKGSTVGALVLYRVARTGKCPKAILIVEEDPVLISGAALADIPVLKITPELYEKLKKGDIVQIKLDKNKMKVVCK